MTSGLRHVVYIYSGEGACPRNTQVVISVLKKHLCAKFHKIQTISPEDTIKGDWRQTASCYVIGGGYDLGFIKCLGYHGTQQIKDYVQDGGAYLGLCAGAYFACSGIEFDKGGQLEVCGERQLKFYPGWCVGPAFGPYDYHTKYGARPAQISCTFPPVEGRGPKQDIKTTMCTYFNGGGFFIPKLQPYKKLFDKCDESCLSKKAKVDSVPTTDENNEGGNKYIKNNEISSERHNKKHTLCLITEGKDRSVYSNQRERKSDNGEIENKDQKESNGVLLPENNERLNNENNKPGSTEDECEKVDILAVYDGIESQPAAIVRCRVGRGVVVLSAVHIEYDSGCLDREEEFAQPVVDGIRSFDKVQERCFSRMLAFLGLKVLYDK